MARSGYLHLQCSYALLTFYKRDDQYFVRKRSSLTREQVKNAPAFAKTRHNAALMAQASRIASAIYNSLPLQWRQFWMFRSFTGEAIHQLKAGSAPQEVHQYLWTTYIQYWEDYQQLTGTNLPTGKKRPVAKTKSHSARLRHRNINPLKRRYRNLLAQNHWKSIYRPKSQAAQEQPVAARPQVCSTGKRPVGKKIHHLIGNRSLKNLDTHPCIMLPVHKFAHQASFHDLYAYPNYSLINSS